MGFVAQVDHVASDTPLRGYAEVRLMQYLTLRETTIYVPKDLCGFLDHPADGPTALPGDYTRQVH